MLIGEAPGAAEAKHGKPFCGASGKYLEKILRRHGISKRCYITNVVKCRPPSNRDPTPREVKSCGIYVRREIEIVQPKAILILGNVAKKALNYADAKRGVAMHSCTAYGNFAVNFTYHPAHVIRNPNSTENIFEQAIMWLRRFA